MTIKQKTSWLAVLPSLVIPICIGLTMYLGLAYMIEQSILTNELLVRYTTGHPISRFTTGMFFIGVASLLMIAKNVLEQFSTESKIQLVDTDSTGTDPTASADSNQRPATNVASRAAACQNNLNEHPGWVKEHYLWQRLSAMMAYLQRSNSTASAETELKYLTELDYERQQQRFALVRILIWATPMLGFLGTVLGISEALGGISVGPENNFETMMNGLRGSLYVAFDTTALALTLSMFLMFGQFLIDRFELQLLSIVDTRVHAEVNRNFDLTSTDDVAMRTFSEQFLETSKEAAINQTKLWKHSIESAQQAWSSTLTDANTNVQNNLTDALSQNALQLTNQLTTAIDRADNAMAHRWQQWQVMLSDNCRLLTGHQKQLAEQTTQFSQMVSEKTDTREFKNALQQNNQAIEATQQLRETLSTLSKSVQAMQQTSAAQTKIVGKLAKATEKPTTSQSSETQALATERLNETLSSLTKSIKKMVLTSKAQTEVTSKLAGAVANQPIIQQVTQPKPQPQAFAGKLRIHDPQQTDSKSQLNQALGTVKAAAEIIPSTAPADKPEIKLALETASINESATKARVQRQAKPTASPKPNNDVVLPTEVRSEKPAVETLRDANNRVANFLSNQSRPNGRRSAA